MKITRQIQVFDSSALTPGSKIKVSGYSCIAEKSFDEAIVEVVKCTQEELTFKHKRRKYTVQFWEHELCDFEIEMVEHVELPPQPLPF